QTTRTIVVRTLDDTLYEGAETFAVNLSGPVGATVTDGQAVGTILDNEPVLAQVRSAAVNGGAAQRSRVTDLAVTFGTQVTFATTPTAAFTLTRNSDGPAGSFTATAGVVGGV